MNKLSELLKEYTSESQISDYSKYKKLDLKSYFDKELALCKDLKSRSQDPTVVPESVLSQTMEQKIAVILEEPFLVELIRKHAHLSRDNLVLNVMDDIMNLSERSLNWRLNLALKTALGILTQGVVSAPRDGLLEVKLDPDNFIRLVLAGPIRAAGGSLMGAIICYAELLRQRFKIDRYVATDDQIDKTTTEVLNYMRTHPAQIVPSSAQISFVIKSCPIMIDGIETQSEVISYNKITPRLPCTKIRGGACLAIVEGLIVRAKKIQSLLKKIGLNWAWMTDLKVMATKYRVAGQRKSRDSRYTLSIGRPLISTSQNSKGLRIRIGKSPTNALCGVTVSPELVDLLRFINIGTQLVVSEPGKGVTITGLSQDLEKPIVKFKNQSVDFYKVGQRENVEQILDLGQMLCTLGDFVQFKCVIKPRDYCRSLWRTHTENTIDNFLELSYEQMSQLHLRFHNTKMHPYYNLFLRDLKYSQFFGLRTEWIKGSRKTLRRTTKNVQVLDALCCSYTINDEEIVPKYPEYLDHHLLGGIDLDPREYYQGDYESVLHFVNKKLKDNNMMMIGQKGYFTITARVGRPENVSLSKMKPQNANSLANFRPAKITDSFWKAIQKQPYSSSRCLIRYCRSCNKQTALRLCPSCRLQTFTVLYCIKCNEYYEYDKTLLHQDHKSRKFLVHYRNYYQQAANLVNKLNKNDLQSYKKVKLKLLAKTNVPYPEPLEKGFFRAKYGLPVTKDGTIGVNAGNSSTTHFTPRMIGTNVKDLRALGYYVDQYGNSLTNEDQIVALKLNDAIYSQSLVDTLIKCTKYIDDLLVYYYDREPYFNVRTKEGLVGLLLITIAPHISNGVVTRLIGFSQNLTNYTHPIAVTTRRRDQDGDIDRSCVLMDCFLNCSRKYVSQNKIGALMSIPLTLSLDLKVGQTGKELLYCETNSKYSEYPLRDNTSVYFPDQLTPYPCYNDFLNKDLREDHIGYNVPNFSISSGSLLNLYKDAQSNESKVDLMLQIQEMLKFVDNVQSLEGVIDGHLFPDIRGNLNAYFRQAFRCDHCGMRHSIDFLSVRCIKCKLGTLKPTVYPRMVTKYVPIMKNLIKRREFDPYFKSKIRAVIQDTEFLTESISNSFRSKIEKGTLK